MNFLSGLMVAAVAFLGSLCAGDDHEFYGRHLIASYLGCDEAAIMDVQELCDVMMDACKESGAQVLGHTFHVFPGNGLTMVILLSESHASIHTYPEHGACFVDIFTCGEQCQNEKFDEVLRAYLKPKSVSQKMLVRRGEDQISSTLEM
jgi:S-adenosylmethionine decarboxylase proenzyme